MFPGREKIDRSSHPLIFPIAPIFSLDGPSFIGQTLPFVEDGKNGIEIINDKGKPFAVIRPGEPLLSRGITVEIRGLSGQEQLFQGGKELDDDSELWLWKDKEGRIHHWQLTMASRPDEEIESMIPSNLSLEIREKLTEEVNKISPKCFIGPNLGVVLVVNRLLPLFGITPDGKLRADSRLTKGRPPEETFGQWRTRYRTDLSSPSSPYFEVLWTTAVFPKFDLWVIPGVRMCSSDFSLIVRQVENLLERNRNGKPLNPKDFRQIAQPYLRLECQEKP